MMAAIKCQLLPLRLHVVLVEVLTFFPAVDFEF